MRTIFDARRRWGFVVFCAIAGALAIPPHPFATPVSALAFGAAHLPSWSVIGAHGTWLLVSVLALNATGALVFGIVFAKRGIAAAMLVRAGADGAIQLIGPLTR